jgi:hypothetical protein
VELGDVTLPGERLQIVRHRRGRLGISAQGADHVDPVERVQMIEVHHVIGDELGADHQIADELGVERQLDVDYHALWADEQSTRTAAQTVNLSGDGDFRRHLFAAWLKSKFSPNVSGHLVAEYLMPGDYYADNRRNDSFFVRAEVVLTW